MIPIRYLTSALAAIFCATAPALADSHLSTREGAFTHWSYFCDDICWISTLTTDREMYIFVAFQGAQSVELSVYFADGRRFPNAPTTMTVGCITDAFLLAENTGFPSDFDANDRLLEQFLFADTGTVQVGDTTRTFLLEGYEPAFEAVGPPLPAPSASPCPGSS